MKKISEWVSDGGTLILVRSAIRKFADSDYAGISKFNSDDEKQAFKKKNEHTALADIRESIAELKYFREHFFQA